MKLDLCAKTTMGHHSSAAEPGHKDCNRMPFFTRSEITDFGDKGGSVTAEGAEEGPSVRSLQRAKRERYRHMSTSREGKVTASEKLSAEKKPEKEHATEEKTSLTFRTCFIP